MDEIKAPFDDKLRQHPGQRREESVGDVDTAFWVYGPEAAATTVLLIHGFRGDHHGLESFAAELGTDFRCVIPDLPGFGESHDFPTAADVSAYAQWLVAFAAAIKGTTRLVAVGHSFGSIVVSAALEAGLVTDDVVLINPIAKNALKGPRAIMTRLAIFYYWFASVLPERLGFAVLRNSLIVRIMSVTMAKTSDAELRAWIHDQHDRYFSHFHSRKAVMQAFTTSVENDVSQYSSGLSRPVLILAADKDDITDIVSQRNFAATLPDVEFHEISGVGHLIHYEAYVWAATLIQMRIERMS